MPDHPSAPPALPGPGQAGTTLTPQQIAGWAQSAGFSGPNLVTAVAVAMAESGGKTDAVSPVNSDGSRDYGVWQINSRAHADKLAGKQWWSVQNAAIAKAVYDEAAASGNRNGWRPWSVYRSGAYMLHYPTATIAARTPEMGAGGGDDATVITPIESIGEGIAAPVTEAANAIKGIAQAVNKAQQWLSDRENWERVGIGAVGAALIVGALVMLARPAVEQATTTAARAVAA